MTRADMRRLLGGTTAFAAAVAIAHPALAQRLDRAKRPVAPPPPPFVFPAVEARTLPNGLAVRIVENHALPLVAVRVVIQDGALLDPAGKAGLFTLDTLLLRDGTTTQTGEQLAQTIDELGSRISPTRFTTVTEEFERSLALMGDMLINPSFPAEAVDRRKAGLTNSLQRDEGIASTPAFRIFTNLLFGADHPLARRMSATSLASIARDDVVQFHDTYVRPQNVTLIVAGDVTPASAMAAVTRVFGSWQRKGASANVVVPAAAPPKPTTIYLYDRPKSPQSTVFIGQAGPPRSTPDVYALETMGGLFGGGTGSRITQSLREKRPLTYAVRHFPVWGRLDDPSTINGSANVDAVKTDSALIVWMGELRDIVGPRPPTDDEIAYARSVTVGNLAVRVETIDEIANRVAAMARERMPLTFYADYVRGMNRVGTAEVAAAAKKYVDPSHTIIVVVGDRSVIEAPLRAANIAPVVIVDENGVVR